MNADAQRYKGTNLIHNNIDVPMLMHRDIEVPTLIHRDLEVQCTIQCSTQRCSGTVPVLMDKNRR